MSASIIVRALRREREQLAVRWLGQLTVNRAAAGRPPIQLDDTLLPALLDEAVDLMVSDAGETIPLRHHADAFAHLADFPENVAVCIDVFQAGTQVLGSFAVENAGPFGAWSRRARNQFLGELDAVFHVLVHREIEALCEHCFCVDPAWPSLESTGSTAALIDHPAQLRAAASRN